MDITRPRISGAEPSWTVLLAVAIQVMLKKPTGTSATAASSGLATIASSSEVSPKAATDPRSRRLVGLARLAVASAPTTEPQAIIEASTPYRLGPPWKLKRASSGRATRKFRPSVATTPVSRMVQRSVGVAQT